MVYFLALKKIKKKKHFQKAYGLEWTYLSIGACQHVFDML